jgi:Domain of unknown function (DUF4249)
MLHIFHKSKAFFIALGAMVFTLTACQSMITEVDSSMLPDTEPKLAVACFISPQDSLITAEVTESKTVLDTGSIRTIYPDANITISDGTDKVTLAYNATLGYYTNGKKNSFTIKAGKTYNLLVNAPELGKTWANTKQPRIVTATTTVPTAIAIKETKVDTSTAISTRRITNVREVTQLNFKILWQDLAGQTDYYRGFAYIDNKNNIDKIGVDFNSIDDFDSDGKLLSIQTSYQLRNNSFTLGKTVQMGLFHADQHYYNYHESLRKQRSNRNPFAEPVLMYSNIKGGYGCFGAYNATWATVKL